MTKIEKRILAILGALFTTAVAIGAGFQGANIATDDISTALQVTGLVATVGGGAGLMGIAYYKAAISENLE